MSLTEEDKQILIYFALLHDIGRDNEEKDDTHGDKSVDLIRSKNIRIKGIQLSKKGYRIAKLIIRHHCRDDEISMERITKMPNFTAKDLGRAVKLYNIAKDMDEKFSYKCDKNEWYAVSKDNIAHYINAENVFTMRVECFVWMMDQLTTQGIWWRSGFRRRKFRSAISIKRTAVCTQVTMWPMIIFLCMGIPPVYIKN
jgi:hypothetical protein